MRKIILLLVLACAAASLPPFPPKAKRLHRPMVSVSQGDGAKLLLAHPRVVIPSTRSLFWNWSPDADNSWSNVVFVVRSSPTLATPRSSWSVAGTSPTNSWSFTINPSVSAAFFFVSTSNTVTHLVSE